MPRKGKAKKPDIYVEPNTLLYRYHEQGLDIPYIDEILKVTDANKLKTLLDEAILDFATAEPAFFAGITASIRGKLKHGSYIREIIGSGYRPPAATKGPNAGITVFEQKRVAGKGPAQRTSEQEILTDDDLLNLYTIIKFIEKNSTPQKLYTRPIPASRSSDPSSIKSFHSGSPPSSVEEPIRVEIHDPLNIEGEPHAVSRFLGEAQRPPLLEEAQLAPTAVNGAGIVLSAEGAVTDPQRNARDRGIYSTEPQLPPLSGRAPTRIITEGRAEAGLAPSAPRIRTPQPLAVRPQMATLARGEGVAERGYTGRRAQTIFNTVIAGQATVQEEAEDILREFAPASEIQGPLAFNPYQGLPPLPLSILSGHSARSVGNGPYSMGPTSKQIRDIEAVANRSKEDVETNQKINELLLGLNRNPTNEPQFISDEAWNTIVANRFKEYARYNLEHCAKNEAATRRQEIQKRMALQDEFNKQFRIPLAPDSKIKSYV